MLDNKDMSKQRAMGSHYTEWFLPQIRRVSRDLTQAAVADEHWQNTRLSMKGVDTVTKMEILEAYFVDQLSRAEDIDIDIDDHAYWKYRELLETRVINYLTALKRGGQIDMEGYLQR